MAKMGPIKLVILDWAGTTLDFGCMAPMEAFRETFAHFGVPITMAEARAPMGAHKKVHIRKITEMETVRGRWRGVHRRDPDSADVDRMFEYFVPVQLNILPKYSKLIPETVEVVRDLQAQGIPVGSTTGYTRPMMEVLMEEARRQGYTPNMTVCADDVREGRPAPWMCIRNAELLGVYPMSAIVKVGDTAGDIAEGRNAGMWAVGVAQTGNEVGLTQAEFDALPVEERRKRTDRAACRLLDAGASLVIDHVGCLPAALDDISKSIERGGHHPLRGF